MAAHPALHPCPAAWHGQQQAEHGTHSAACTRVTTPALPTLPPPLPAAATVLNSTCNDLNTTGCCVQAPASNLTLAQFGLGVSGGPA